MRALSGKAAKAATVRVPDTSLKTVVGKRERSRRARTSKSKGSSYERKIAKKLGAWSGETLRRTPQSGGWAGGAAHGVSGDLVCDRPKRWPFHCELKKREGWGLEDLIVGLRASTTDTRSVLGWWDQTIRTCPAGKMPMLIFARNHLPDLVMMKQGDFAALTPHDFTVWFLPHFVFTTELHTLVILALDDFIVKVRPPEKCRGHKTWREPTAETMARAARRKDNDS